MAREYMKARLIIETSKKTEERKNKRKTKRLELSYLDSTIPFSFQSS
jgi:hypothetical protein